MRILGITGGIATGKSVTLSLLAALGAPTLSADQIARDLLTPDAETTRAVIAQFPQSIDPADPSGRTIDRRALGRIVFADPAARRTLEALTHPRIVAVLERQARAWRADPDGCAAALEVPLLFEAGLTPLVDLIVVAACREDVQIARLRDRLGIDESEARRQIAAQWPLPEKAALADRVITTDDGLVQTRRQVEALWQDCCGKEDGKRP